MSLLDVRDVSKRFGGVRAVDQVALEVEPGETHGLIGPNGSGKTTLLNLVTGVYRPDGGQIWLNNKRIDGLPPFRVSRLGMARTFQNLRVFQRLTVLENVMAAQIPDARAGFFHTVFGTSRSREEIVAQRDRARELLDLVGLADGMNLPGGALSYGQQKLLEIARALARDPTLLLLDEPAAGLNDAFLDELLRKLEEIRARGVTLLIIEHRMKVIMTLCHRITVLNFGKRIAVGSPKDIQSDAAVIEAYLGHDEEG